MTANRIVKDTDGKPSTGFDVLLARIRIPLFWLAVAVFVVGLVTGTVWLVMVVPFLILVSLVVYFRLGTLTGKPEVLASPVGGRWVALNSPTTRVPSHGMHAYGQTYAVDLVFEPAPGARPTMGWSPMMRPPTDFPAFGRPVLAPAAGTVVRARGRARDHRARNSWPGLIYLMAEGAIRELTGPGRILGNHIVLRLDDGRYAALAHLHRHSLLVRPGDRVDAGQPLAQCGNSGNTSEPHVHLQVMDSPHVLFAGGLPFAFTGVEVEDASGPTVPANGEAMLAYATANDAATPRRGSATDEEGEV